MTPGGWITMLVSVGAVVALFFWCLYRVLFYRPAVDPEHLHGELDIKPKDRD